MNKYIKDNTQCFMLDILDGFRAHLELLPEMAQMFENEILSLKEEGNSSHVNKAYDKFVAKYKKVAKYEILAMLRGTTSISQGVVNQWGLIQFVLHIIRATNRETWTRYFDACNMDPRTRVSFQDRLNNIERFLQAGQSFKAVAVDSYLLLPTFWYGMEP